MIPTAERIQSVLRLPEGSFDEVPFALLLHALAADRRSVTVEMGRRAVRKELVLQDGVPVQCSSNLAHETLGRFLVSTGKLNEVEASRLFAEAVARGALLGQVLVERDVMRPEELERLLQHNLAHKLLDAFTWREGTFAIRPTLLTPDTPLEGQRRPAHLAGREPLRAGRDDWPGDRGAHRQAAGPPAVPSPGRW